MVIKKSKSNNDLNDLLAVSFFALIALLAYDKDKNPAEIIGSIVSASFIILIIISLVVVALLFLRSDKNLRYRGEEKTKAETQFVDLEWGQALKHDLLTYFIPVLILSLPILAGQVPDFIDFFQALTVFLSLVYLKMLYWQRIF